MKENLITSKLTAKFKTFPSKINVEESLQKVTLCIYIYKIYGKIVMLGILHYYLHCLDLMRVLPR